MMSTEKKSYLSVTLRSRQRSQKIVRLGRRQQAQRKKHILISKKDSHVVFGKAKFRSKLVKMLRPYHCRPCEEFQEREKASPAIYRV